MAPPPLTGGAAATRWRCTEGQRPVGLVHVGHKDFVSAAVLWSEMRSQVSRMVAVVLAAACVGVLGIFAAPASAAPDKHPRLEAVRLFNECCLLDDPIKNPTMGVWPSKRYPNFAAGVIDEVEGP